MNKKTIMIVVLCFVFCVLVAGYFHMFSNDRDEIEIIHGPKNIEYK